MLSILAAILLFGFIVLIHETGHFLFAKLNGIGVVEFSIGMGPRLVSKVRGETRYSIKALPFGGSCMMLGEDENEADEKAFNNKSVWARISVIAAGPVFNFILAFLFAMIIVSYIGHDYPVLHAVSEGSPAEEAGLLAGDEITRINTRNISGYRDVTLYIMSHPGKALEVTYKRDNQSHKTVVVPRYSEENQSYMMGVSFQPYQKTTSAAGFLSASAYEIKYCVVSTFDSFRMIFQKQIAVGEAVSGPVRIVSLVGETVTDSNEAGGLGAVFYTLSYWCMLLSASLGLMNLLPIPALDGGRLVFLFIEVLRGKPLDAEKEAMVHMAGMMVLMTLMVLVLFNDLRNLF